MIIARNFTTPEVLAAAGLGANTFQSYLRRDMIVGARGITGGGGQGRGHARSYTWHAMMQIAVGAALVEAGVAPADAFKAAGHFAHMGSGGAPGSDVPRRTPGLPYHPREGETYLLMVEDASRVVLAADGSIPLNAVPSIEGHPAIGFTALDLTAVFYRVCDRLDVRAQDVLREAYGV